MVAFFRCWKQIITRAVSREKQKNAFELPIIALNHNTSEYFILWQPVNKHEWNNTSVTSLSRPGVQNFTPQTTPIESIDLWGKADNQTPARTEAATRVRSVH